MAKSRVQNTIYNLMGGVSFRFINMFSSFVVRTVFIRCISEVYLGINGLYSSIFTMLSLAELGFGTAMVYSMYQPLADNDHEKLCKIMKLYKKVYFWVGAFILTAGLLLIPFLPALIKDRPDLEGLNLYYVLYLISTVSSYWFFAYRNSILQADQKAYIVSNYNSVISIVKAVLQIILLVVFHSFTVYLLTQIACNIAQNILVAYKVDKDYPFLKKYKVENMSVHETKRIFKDVKALAITKIGHVVLYSTDNMIISSVIGITYVGVLSNFNLVVDAVTGVLCQITAAMQASLGNFFAKEDKNSGYNLFKQVEFLNYWLYGFSTIALVTLLNPFVYLWLGERFTTSMGVVVALGINFFVAGYMNTLWTFRSTLGLFTQGQYRPIGVAIINVVVSIILGKRFGVAGVLAGTFISRAAISLWYDPLIILKYGFHQSVKPFYVRYLKRVALLGVSVVGMNILSRMILLQGITIISFGLLTILTAVIPNVIFIMVFHRTDEFKYFFSMIKEKLQLSGNR